LKNTIILSTLIYLLLISTSYSSQEPNFVGMWSNQKGSFSTLNLGLRGDGRGLLSTAVYSLLVRWVKTEDGIRIRTTSPMEESLGTFTTTELIFDKEKNTLIIDKSDSDKVLYKVSEKEPEDHEKKLVQHLLQKRQEEREEREERKNNEKLKTNELSSIDEIIISINELLRKKNRHIFITNKKDNWYIYISSNWFNGLYQGNLQIKTLVLSNGEDNILTSRKCRKCEVPDLPTIYQLSNLKISNLKSNFENNDLSFIKSKYISVNIWNIVNYNEALDIANIKGTDLLTSMVEYLLKETYKESSGPYELKCH